jgi:hypothetical protein
MSCRTEAPHVNVEHPDAICVAFLAMSAEQLLSDADAKNRLAQVPYQLVEVSLAQILHRSARLSLSGKYHLVGSLYRFGIVGQHR